MKLHFYLIALFLSLSCFSEQGVSSLKPVSNVIIILKDSNDDYYYDYYSKRGQKLRRTENFIAISPDQKTIKKIAQQIKIIDDPRKKTKHKLAALTYLRLFNSSKVTHLYSYFADSYDITYLKKMPNGISKIKYTLAGKSHTVYSPTRCLNVSSKSSNKSSYTLRFPYISSTFYYSSRKRNDDYYSDSKLYKKTQKVNKTVPVSDTAGGITAAAKYYYSFLDPKAAKLVEKNITLYAKACSKKSVLQIKNSTSVKLLQKLPNGTCKITYKINGQNQTGYSITALLN